MSLWRKYITHSTPSVPTEGEFDAIQSSEDGRIEFIQGTMDSNPELMLIKEEEEGGSWDELVKSLNNVNLNEEIQ